MRDSDEDSCLAPIKAGLHDRIESDNHGSQSEPTFLDRVFLGRYDDFGFMIRLSDRLRVYPLGEGPDSDLRRAHLTRQTSSML